MSISGGSADENGCPLADVFRRGKCRLINHAIYYIFPLFFLAPGRVAGLLCETKRRRGGCGLCPCQPAACARSAALTILATRKEKRRVCKRE